MKRAKRGERSAGYMGIALVDYCVHPVMTPSTPLRQFARLTRSVQDRSELSPIRAMAFYSAIGLPLLYLPLLANGLSSSDVPLFVALVCANLAALFAGHSYREE